jgi:oligoendopeptidase F
VNALLERVAQHAQVYKRYQGIRVDHIREFSGLKTVNVWDMSIQPEGMPTPRFTITHGTQIIRDSLAPLGPIYGKELTALLDPANGRMDIVPGENRKSGGFSRGFIGTESIFYSAGFNGSYNDLRILTHESTHAIHRQLMNQSNVLAPYASGPNYLFESFAIFSEFLLPDYLYNQEKDPQRKQYFLEQFLDGKGMILFVAGPEAILEQAIYDGVGQDTIHDAPELDAITKAVFSKFSIWPEKQQELKHQWMMIPLMYEDPFYDVNYVYGGLLALKYYELYTRDPKHFVPQYIALMSNGFDAPPATLLKKFLNIDLNDPNLVSDAVKIIEKRVSLLEESYSHH